MTTKLKDFNLPTETFWLVCATFMAGAASGVLGTVAALMWLMG